MEVFDMEKQRRKKVKELEKLEKVKIGYARVSSQDDRQKLVLEVQTEALKNFDIIFSEKRKSILSVNKSL